MRTIAIVALAILSLTACIKRDPENFMIAATIRSSIDSLPIANTAFRVRKSVARGLEDDEYFFTVTTDSSGHFNSSLPIGGSGGIQLAWPNGREIASEAYFGANYDFGIVYTRP